MSSYYSVTFQTGSRKPEVAVWLCYIVKLSGVTLVHGTKLAVWPWFCPYQSCPRITFLGPDPAKRWPDPTQRNPRLLTISLTRPAARPFPHKLCAFFNWIIIPEQFTAIGPPSFIWRGGAKKIVVAHFPEASAWGVFVQRFRRRFRSEEFFRPEIYCEGPLYDYEYEYGYEYWFTDS